ncbi:ATP-binding cassette domain-containing protein [Bacillus chungangensis]|uniref:ATP-binding cassette subfamily C protein n=1 Tax=Bacillus chungangensis TaxID=587633 RepID=A0ABT9WRJ8_9BACI|nr:ABC transporter ATP-binding protein [Bacillus chungangensis]MDQ0175918.1 ATP-binding cassette subfamily C protein [Bacillus chungangensis]
MKYFKIDFKLISLLLCNLITSVVSVLFPLSLMKVTDSLVSNEMKSFYFYLTVALVIMTIQMTMTYLGSRINNTYVMYRLIEIRTKVIESLLRSDYTTFKKKKNDEYLALVLSNLQVLDEDYYKSVLNVITKVMLLFMSLVTLFVINPLLMISLVFFIILIGTFPLLFSKKILSQKKQFISATEQYTNSTTECLYGYEVIKINRIAEIIIGKYESAIHKMEQKGRELGNTIVLANVVFGSSTMLLLLLIFLIGGYSVSQGTLTIGSLIACIQLMMYVVEPAINITQEVNTIQSTKPIREQINDIIKTEENMFEKQLLNESIRLIKLENVSYQYPEEETSALRNFSFTFEAGKKYALIGGNGSGKSTLLKIIANLITDYTGSMKVNNHEDKDVNFQHIGYIDQYNFLFNTTVLENINLLKGSSIDYNELKNLFKRLQLDSFIADHPEGLHFVVGDNGEYLSGGQRQKICIARALLNNPDILLLDEPNSALDLESSNEIDDILSEWNDIICIMVTHKLDDSLKGFDEILVLENGVLVDSGSYDELLIERNTFLPAEA